MYFICKRLNDSLFNGLCIPLLFVACNSVLAATQTNNAAGFSGEMVPQIGHTQEIVDIIYASNGEFIVTSARDGKVKLWTPDGRLLRTISPNRQIARIALSPNNILIAIATNGGVVELWSAKGRHILNFPRMKVMQFSNLAFSPDQRYLIACSRSSKKEHCQLFDLRGGRLATINITDQGNSTIKDVAISPKGEHIYIAAHQSVFKFDETGQMLKQFKVTDGFLSVIALSPDGQRLATAVAYRSPSMDQSLGKGKLFTHIWDANGNAIAHFPSHSTRDLEFSQDGEWVMSGGAHDNRILIHDKNGEHIRSLKIGKHRVTSPAHVALSPDRKYIVTADHRFKPVSLNVLTTSGKLVKKFNQYTSSFTNMTVAPNSDLIVTTSSDNQIRFWSLDGRLLTSFSSEYDYPALLAIAPNRRYFVSGGKTLSVWNAPGKKISSVDIHKKGGRAVSFTADGQHILTGGADGYVNVIPIGKGKSLRFKAHDGKSVESVAAHPDGQLFATGSIWERVAIWNIKGEKIASYAPPKNTKPPFSNSYAISFSPDGKHLIVATTRKKQQLRVLDLNGTLIRSIDTGNTDSNGAIAISTNGKWLAASVNQNIGLWDLATWEFRGSLEGHQGGIRALAFSKDKHLVSASADGTMRVWNLDNNKSFSIQSNKDEWVIYNKNGYFDASRYGGDLVAVVDGLQAYGVDQLALRYNRPDLIYSETAIGNDDYISHFQNHYRKRANRYDIGNGGANLKLSAPVVQITKHEQESGYVDIEFEATDRRNRVVAVQVYANNVPLYSGLGKNVDNTENHFQERVQLAPGNNKIEVSAFNRSGIESLRAQVDAQYHSNQKGDLYFIGLGVSQYQDAELNLKYAHKDVEDMNAIMRRYKNHFNRIHSLPLTDNRATRNALKEIREFLAQATVKDTVVMLVSGHGSYDLGEKATYYYISHETDVNDLSNTAIAFSDLEGLMSGIKPRKKLLLLDTCESGEMDGDSLANIQATVGANNLSVRTSKLFREQRKSNRRTYLYARDRYIYNDLSRRTGTIIFSSSLAEEVSIESSAIENGVFTEAILQILSTPKADTNNDGYLSMNEIETGVKAWVSKATLDTQHPEITRDNVYQEFKLPLLSK
ncbi:caspase family protein [Kaarinaea lacus]